MVISPDLKAPLGPNKTGDRKTGLMVKLVEESFKESV